MAGRSLKELAEKKESKGDYWAERVYKKERFINVPPEELIENKRKAYKNYVEAAKIYATIGNIKKENEMRKEASRYASLKPSRLEKRLGFATLTIGTLFGALFFSVFSLTGYAVEGLNQNNSRWFGVALFVLGLIFSFLYLREKKK